MYCFLKKNKIQHKSAPRSHSPYIREIGTALAIGRIYLIKPVN